VVRDETTDLARADIRLYIDGRPKGGFSYDRTTNRLTFNSTTLSYGVHTVRVEATDEVGNESEKAWSFRVVR
jgi:hypothetical protein